MAPQGLAARGRRSFKGYTECAMQTASQRREAHAIATGLLRFRLVALRPNAENPNGEY
jgi:hypothetical protein